MDNTENIPSLLSMCTGYGGLEIGIERAIGRTNILAHVEIEAFAITNLVDKMETGQMVPAPIWTDVKTFPAKLFRGKVGILTAGYPCQPFSTAGKRQGTEDPRHLWPHIRRHIQTIKPVLCWFENVEGHITLGLSTVLSDLEADGYKVKAGIFSASEVGAPHQRKRVFILAYRNDGQCELALEEILARRDRVAGCYSELADTCCKGREGVQFAGEDKRKASRGGASSPLPIAEFRDDIRRWPARPGEEQYPWEEPRAI